MGLSTSVNAHHSSKCESSVDWHAPAALQRSSIDMVPLYKAIALERTCTRAKELIRSLMKMYGKWQSEGPTDRYMNQVLSILLNTESQRRDGSSTSHTHQMYRYSTDTSSSGFFLLLWFRNRPGSTHLFDLCKPSEVFRKLAISSRPTFHRRKHVQWPYTASTQ